MLENCAGFVGTDALWHHVEDVVHDGSSELEIKVRLTALLGHGLGSSTGSTALKVAREEVAQPSLQERDDAAQEKEPNTPARRPEAHTGTLSNRT